MIQHDIDTLSRQLVCNNLSIVGAYPSLKQETQQQKEERNAMHKTFSFEYSLRHSAKTTQQHNITIKQPINNQQQDIHVTTTIEMERIKQN